MPIVSPWVFYLINVLGQLKVIFAFLIVTLAPFIGYTYAKAKNCYDEKYKQYYYSSVGVTKEEARKKAKEESDPIIKKCNAFVRRATIACTIMLVLFSLIPSQKTMYKMLVANFVTYENVETATDAIKDSVDYIFDKLDGEEE